MEKDGERNLGLYCSLSYNHQTEDPTLTSLIQTPKILINTLINTKKRKGLGNGPCLVNLEINTTSSKIYKLHFSTGDKDSKVNNNQGKNKSN